VYVNAKASSGSICKEIVTRYWLRIMHM